MRPLASLLLRILVVSLALTLLVAARSWPLVGGLDTRLPGDRLGQPLPGACTWVAELAQVRALFEDREEDSRAVRPPKVRESSPRAAPPARNASWGLVSLPLADRGALRAANVVRLLALFAGAFAAFGFARALGARGGGAFFAAAGWITAGVLGGADMVGQPWLPLAAWTIAALFRARVGLALLLGACLGALGSAAALTTAGGGVAVALGGLGLALAARRSHPVSGDPDRVGRSPARSREAPRLLAASLAIWAAVVTFVALRSLQLSLFDGTDASGRAALATALWPAFSAGAPAPSATALFGIEAAASGLPRLGLPLWIAALAAIRSVEARRLAAFAWVLAVLALLPGAPAAVLIPPALLAACAAGALGIGALGGRALPASVACAACLAAIALGRHHQRELDLSLPPAVLALGEVDPSGRVLFVPAPESEGTLLVWEAVAGREAALARLSPRDLEILESVAPDALRLARGTVPDDVASLALDLDLLSIDHVVVDGARAAALYPMLDALDRWERGALTGDSQAWWYRRSLAGRMEAAALVGRD